MDELPQVVPDSVSSGNSGNWMQTLWKEVLEKKLDDILVEDAPIIEIDLDKPGANVDEESRYGDCGSEKTSKSKTNSLKTLPSFVGEYEVKSDVHNHHNRRKSMTKTPSECPGE